VEAVASAEEDGTWYVAVAVVVETEAVAAYKYLA
jgi:hypothetical protein